MSQAENTLSDEIPEELVIAVAAYLLFEGEPGFATRGSIGFVKAKAQTLPPPLEDEE